MRHVGSVIVLPEATVAWSIDDPAALSVEHLAPVLDCEPTVEILLFGGGRNLVPVAASLRQTLNERGVVIEPMDTGAACRTFAVLAAEGRRVAAALVAVD